MKVTTTIKLPTYNCSVVFIVTDKMDDDSKKLYKKLNILDEFEGGNEGLLVCPDIDVYYLFVDTKYLTHNTLAHEIYHAVVRVTEDRMVSDEEAQAWLCGHLTEVIYKFLNKKKLEVKHG